LVDTLFAQVPGCRIELRPDRERVLVLLDGELDLAAVESVDCELEGLRSAGWRQVVLDLGAVGFMDLAGVRLLLGAFEQADRAGSLFMVVAASPQVRRILELTGNAHVLGGAEWSNAVTNGARDGCSAGTQMKTASAERTSRAYRAR
jgi:anti-sigma B factor antagonist